MRTLGIDEAGRGCVLGPLFVGAFLYDGGGPEPLWDAGAADSKRLSPARRAAVRSRLEALGTWEVVAIDAERIDTGNLNTLEEEAIAALVARHRPDRVIIDALGPPSALPAALRRLQAASGVEAEWLMEPKADANHAPVAAASIFAKTERDAHLEQLRERWGALGSGYPSDPTTRRWLLDLAARGAQWPPFVRTRWDTIAKLSQQALALR
ncbi:MAG: ribonuclease HII [Deltaproteobacteria bacterium]|nr:ribonuclease HII [Deltaproteobacteria bacterium]